MITSPPFLPLAGTASSDIHSTDPMTDAVDRLELAHGIYTTALVMLTDGIRFPGANGALKELPDW
ncbi:hypothetical protein P3T22_000467 [Paraburkholderia sp. GAS348]